MAKQQSRRSISLNRQLYDIAKSEAEANHTSFAQWVTAIIRRQLEAAGRELPKQTHMSFDDVRKAAIAKQAKGNRRVKRVA